MLFSSAEFILVFLPVVLLGYFVLASRDRYEVSKLWLVAASLFFYAWWKPGYLVLIGISAVINFGVGARLSSTAATSTTRGLLVAGVGFNLGLLGYFKYADFAVANMNALGGDFELPAITLPLAISFFTFQQIAYLVDAHRGRSTEPDFWTYFLFVTFFPQLIAGPIVHHSEMMPQFRDVSNRRPIADAFMRGLFFFSIGLFKKVALADTFGRWADAGFSAAAPLPLLDAWVTSLSYTFQIYFDFSGYSDMAIGLAMLFNIRLPFNFDSPYQALDIRDFWRRWHITLSRFLREYLYIPLGGSRRGESRTWVSLFVTFLLGGLWHGASWMFVLWGVMHGSALVVNRVWRRAGLRMPTPLAWFATFAFVNVTWVFFRAEDLASAMKVLRGMAGLSGVDPPLEAIPTSALAWLGPAADSLAAWMPWTMVVNMVPVLLLVLAFVIASRPNYNDRLQEGAGLSGFEIVLSAVLASVGLGLALMSPSEVFLYFNF